MRNFTAGREPEFPFREDLAIANNRSVSPDEPGLLESQSSAVLGYHPVLTRNRTFGGTVSTAHDETVNKRLALAWFGLATQDLISHETIPRAPFLPFLMLPPMTTN
jgi:hypothetical protein